jgi:GT2 family glycosyltransferase
VEPKRYPLAVVIPTYNRAYVLMQCLKHLEDQNCKDFEVVIVDDGSTDTTPVRMEAYLRSTPLAIRYTCQENGGPARARNHAISMVEAPIALLIGDDIFASPALVAEHLQLHQKRPAESVAGLGLSRWSEKGQSVTPFMQWLDSDGVQFDYGPLLRGKSPDWADFYTSNLSLKTKVLKEFPFDETFPYAAMEDMELACRIEARNGLEMVFLPEALAHHLHPTTFAQACRRMVMVGESTAHFDPTLAGEERHRTKHPEASPAEHPPISPQLHAYLGQGGRLVTQAGVSKRAHALCARLPFRDGLQPKKSKRTLMGQVSGLRLFERRDCEIHGAYRPTHRVFAVTVV